MTWLESEALISDSFYSSLVSMMAVQDLQPTSFITSAEREHLSPKEKDREDWGEQKVDWLGSAVSFNQTEKIYILDYVLFLSKRVAPFTPAKA